MVEQKKALRKQKTIGYIKVNAVNFFEGIFSVFMIQIIELFHFRPQEVIVSLNPSVKSYTHAIPHTVSQNLTEFWPSWTPFPIRFLNLTEFSYHLISYFLKN